jgi:uncharacterized protein
MRSIALAALLVASTLGAQTPQRLTWVPNPTPRGWVADPARHLSAATVDSINTIITHLERDEGAEMAVVVIDSLDGLEPADAALELHRRWGVGKKGMDNGLLLLWSPALRKIYVSVGYGLEGVLPDARAGRIQDEHMLPAFRAGDFDRGVLAGVAALASAAREDSAWRDPRLVARAQSAGRDRSIIAPVTLTLAPAALLMLSVAWFRRRPRRCPRGHGRMRLLDERADNVALDSGQQVEERLKSVDYDVWVCDACDSRKVVRRAKWFSSYSSCPKCKRRTVKSTTRTIRSATTASTGLAEVTRDCKHCGFHDVDLKTTPRITTSSGGGSSGGSSFSGGGGGGGSSFGGGSAGGGGAGRSY